MQNTIANPVTVDLTRTRSAAPAAKPAAADAQPIQTTNVSIQAVAPALAGGESAASSSRNAESLQEAVGKINEFIQVVRRDIHFSVDESSGRTIITVVDAETQEIVRQIPPEEILAIAQNLQEASGLLFKAKA